MLKPSLSTLLLVALFAGCNSSNLKPPVISADAAKDAEPEVRDAPADRLVKLTSQELNDIFQKKQENNWAVPTGRIYEVTGKVKEVIAKAKDKENPNEYVRLALYLPEYAAVSVECYFAITHKDDVQKLKTGELVTIRGKLSNPSHIVRENVLDLQGCVLGKK